MSKYNDDWQEVVTIYEGDYSWSQFEGYYSPSARRYFWYTDCGCSCNGWEDPDTVEEWENGDRAALLRGVDEFYTDTPEDKHEAKMSVRNFKES